MTLSPGYEAARIELVDGLVHKYLRAVVTPTQARLRVLESRRWAELLPLTYDPETHCLTGAFVDGPQASPAACRELRLRFAAEGRAYLCDILERNVIASSDGPVIVDWAVHATHRDFIVAYVEQPGAVRWRPPASVVNGAIEAALDRYRALGIETAF